MIRTAMSENTIVQMLREVMEPSLICTDADTRAFMARDALSPFRLPAGAPVQPHCVVRPRDVDDVAAVLRIANAANCPVIPVGGGSGLMGGASSITPGVVLDLRQLQEMELRPADRMADVGAGVTIQALNDAAEPHGLMCGHDPWTVAVATVGGTISTNSLGYLGGKYGSMGAQVLGLEAVMPTGEIIRTRAVEKTSTGPSLHALLVGGEGCFGVITRATLRLVPLPQTRILQAWSFGDFAAGFAAINEILAAGIRPGLLDYGDREPSADQDTPSELIISYEGPKIVAQAEAKAAAALCVQSRGKLGPRREAERFWQERHASGNAYARNRAAGKPWDRQRPRFDYLHVALPPAAVLEYRRLCLEMMAQQRCHVHQTGLWDHAGLFSLSYSVGSETSHDEVHDALLKACQDLHGAMEYCHGVGTRLAGLMRREHGVGLDILRRLKHCLDPQGILNPGKLALMDVDHETT
jgi:FAD/FMN-containing dehydrogenase